MRKYVLSSLSIIWEFPHIDLSMSVSFISWKSANNSFSLLVWFVMKIKLNLPPKKVTLVEWKKLRLRKTDKMHVL